MVSLTRSTYLIRFCLPVLLAVAISLGIFQGNAYAYESTNIKLSNNQVGSTQNTGITDVEVTHGTQKYTQHFHCNGWAQIPKTPGKYTFSSLTGSFFGFTPVLSKLQITYHYTIDTKGGRWVETLPQKLNNELKELKADMEKATAGKLTAIINLDQE